MTVFFIQKCQWTMRWGFPHFNRRGGWEVSVGPPEGQASHLRSGLAGCLVSFLFLLVL